MYDYSSSDEEVFLHVVDDHYLELLEEGRKQAFFRELAFQEGDLPEQTNLSIVVDRNIVVNHLRELPFYNQPIELDFIVRRYYNIANPGPGLQPLGNIMAAQPNQQQQAAAAAAGGPAAPQPPAQQIPAGPVPPPAVANPPPAPPVIPAHWPVQPAGAIGPNPAPQAPAVPGPGLNQHLQGARNRLNRIHHNYWHYDPLNPGRGPARAPAHRLGPDPAAALAPVPAGAPDPADPGDPIDPADPCRLPCCMPPVGGSANLLEKISYKPFSGKSEEDPQSFIEDMENYKDTGNLTDEGFRLLFKSLLIDGASDWYSRLKPDLRRKGTPEELLQAFEKKYSSAKDKMMIKQRLMSKKYVPGQESLDSHLKKMLGWASTIKMPDDELVLIIKYSMPPGYQQLLLMTEDKDLDEFQRKLRTNEQTASSNSFISTAQVYGQVKAVPQNQYQTAEHPPYPMASQQVHIDNNHMHQNSYIQQSPIPSQTDNSTAVTREDLHMLQAHTKQCMDMLTDALTARIDAMSIQQVIREKENDQKRRDNERTERRRSESAGRPRERSRDRNYYEGSSQSTPNNRIVIQPRFYSRDSSSQRDRDWTPNQYNNRGNYGYRGGYNNYGNYNNRNNRGSGRGMNRFNWRPLNRGGWQNRGRGNRRNGNGNRFRNNNRGFRGRRNNQGYGSGGRSRDSSRNRSRNSGRGNNRRGPDGGSDGRRSRGRSPSLSRSSNYSGSSRASSPATFYSDLEDDDDYFEEEDL